ncbi:MAG: hypothetical protein R2695_04220 [Acidimicrobiales bacterium]
MLDKQVTRPNLNPPATSAPAQPRPASPTSPRPASSPAASSSPSSSPSPPSPAANSAKATEAVKAIPGQIVDIVEIPAFHCSSSRQPPHRPCKHLRRRRTRPSAHPQTPTPPKSATCPASAPSPKPPPCGTAHTRRLPGRALHDPVHDPGRTSTPPPAASPSAPCTASPPAPAGPSTKPPLGSTQGASISVTEPRNRINEIRVVFEGQSLNNLPGTVFTQPGIDYPTELIRLLAADGYLVNGRTIAQSGQNFAHRANAAMVTYPAVVQRYRLNIGSSWGGFSDFAADLTAAQVLALKEAEADRMRTFGFDKVVALNADAPRHQPIRPAQQVPHRRPMRGARRLQPARRRQHQRQVRRRRRPARQPRHPRQRLRPVLRQPPTPATPAPQRSPRSPSRSSPPYSTPSCSDGRPRARSAKASTANRWSATPASTSSTTPTGSTPPPPRVETIKPRHGHITTITAPGVAAFVAVT